MAPGSGPDLRGLLPYGAKPAAARVSALPKPCGGAGECNFPALFLFFEKLNLNTTWYYLLI